MMSIPSQPSMGEGGQPCPLGDIIGSTRSGRPHPAVHIMGAEWSFLHGISVMVLLCDVKGTGQSLFRDVIGWGGPSPYSDVKDQMVPQ